MRISALHIHPVKSLRGCTVDSLDLEPWGPRGDRRWLVVDADNRFITQREHPELATVRAELTAEGLRLSRSDLGAVEVAQPEPQERATVTVFRTKVDAAVAQGEGAAWLTALVGEPCRLVFMDRPATARPAEADAGPVSFADELPLLLTSVSSLAHFNRTVGQASGMERFRPNLVVEGAEAWAEDTWAGLTIGGTAFEVVQDCGRCVVTTVDQQTGCKGEDAQPLRALGEMRRDSRGKVLFGVHLRPLGDGVVRVGDSVEVASTREPFVRARPRA